MQYYKPSEIAGKFEISVKTVYNHINKYPDKIRTKKEFWKTYVNFEDFENLYFKNYNNISKTFPDKEKRNIETDSKLQDSYKELSVQVENLKKQNNNLHEQTNKYAILFKEEKLEKNERIQKYDKIQSLLNEKVIEFGNEKYKLSKRFYILLWISIMLILIIGSLSFLWYYIR